MNTMNTWWSNNQKPDIIFTNHIVISEDEDEDEQEDEDDVIMTTKINIKGVNYEV